MKHLAGLRLQWVQHGAGPSIVLFQMWLDHSPVCEGRTWALCGPGATGCLWAARKKNWSEALTPQDSWGPVAWLSQGSHQGQVYLVLSKPKRNPCVCSWQHCRDELDLGSSPPSQSQRPLSAHTQTGPPRVEVVLCYLHQPLLPITHHQLFGRYSNDNSGSDLGCKFLISTTRELLLKWVTKLPFYLHSFIQSWMNASQKTTQNDGRPCTCLLIQDNSV